MPRGKAWAELTAVASTKTGVALRGEVGRILAERLAAFAAVEARPGEIRAETGVRVTF